MADTSSEYEVKLHNGIRFYVHFDYDEYPKGQPRSGVYVQFDYEELGKTIGDINARVVATKLAQEFEQNVVSGKLLNKDEIPEKKQPAEQAGQEPDDDDLKFIGPTYYCANDDRAQEVIKTFSGLIGQMNKNILKQNQTPQRLLIETVLSAHQGSQLTADKIRAIAATLDPLLSSKQSNPNRS